MRVFTLFAIGRRKNETIEKMNISMFKYVQTLVGPFPRLFSICLFLENIQDRYKRLEFFCVYFLTPTFVRECSYIKCKRGPEWIQWVMTFFANFFWGHDIFLKIFLGSPLTFKHFIIIFKFFIFSKTVIFTDLDFVLLIKKNWR